MTTFLQCFWMFTQIVFALFWNLVSSFGKVYDPFRTVFLGASFIYFSKFSKFRTRLSDFSDSRPKKTVFLAWGPFYTFFFVQKIIDLFTVLQILYKFWKMFHNISSYEPSRQYDISPFSKTIINKSI